MTATPLHRYISALPRGVIIALEVMVILAVILAGAVTYGLYRLSQGPIDLEFMRPYVERALSERGESVEMRVEQATLRWPHISGPIELRLRGLDIRQNGESVLAIHDVALALAKAPLLIGRIRPERLILYEPTILFERGTDSRVTFSLIQANDLKASDHPEKNAMTAAFSDFLSGRVPQGYGAFSHVNEISIARARVRMADATQGMTWRLNNVNLSFRALDIGVYGKVDIGLPKGQQFSLLATYHRAGDRLVINSQFRDFALSMFAGRFFGIDFLRHQRLPLTGAFSLQGKLKDPSLTELSLNAVATEGAVDTRDLVGTDLSVQGLRIDLAYDQKDAALKLNDLAFRLADIPVRATGIMRPDSSGNYTGGIDLMVDQVPLDTVRTLWPEDQKNTEAGRWITHKLSKGIIQKLNLHVPLWMGRKTRQLTFLAMQPRAEFSFDTLDADYHAPLYPVTGARGHGTYQQDILSLNIESAQIRDLRVKESQISIHDLSKKGAGHAELDLNLDGPVRTVLQYITLDPILLGDVLPVAPDAARGQGAYHIKLNFPTVQDLQVDQIDVDVAARLDDLVLPKITKGQTLSGGPYDLRVVDGKISFSGSGALAGRPIKLDVKRPIERVGQDPVLSITAYVDSDAALRTAFGADLDFLQGTVVADVTYTEHAEGVENVKIAADLTGTRIFFDALRYEKAPGLKANALLDLKIKNGLPIEARGLTISGPNLDVQNGSLEFGKIDEALNVTRATLPDFAWGKSRARVLYRRLPEKMEIQVTGARLDLSPYLSARNDHTAGPALRLSAQVDELKLAGKDPLRKADLAVELNSRMDLEQLKLIGTAGAGATTIRYVPDAQGRMTLDLSARDAGAFLRAMDIYPNMIAGDLRIKGSPIGNNNRDVKGDLIIENFSVVKAPVLAQLLGVMSPDGINEQLSNKGIGFERLESGFAWLRRPNLDLMSFREGRTSGSALGLTFDGIYDRRRGSVEINGTIIPVSGLNTFASNIPLLGQILTGGKGSALFAATYQIKGPSDAPKTSINPLSVLTPGILRKIFFENAPQDPVKK